MMGAGEYRFIQRGSRDVKTCYHWDDIPHELDALIAFKPEIPPEPHTEEEHEMIETLPAKMQEIMARCQR